MEVIIFLIISIPQYYITHSFQSLLIQIIHLCFPITLHTTTIQFQAELVTMKRKLFRIQCNHTHFKKTLLILHILKTYEFYEREKGLRGQREEESKRKDRVMTRLGDSRCWGLMPAQHVQRQFQANRGFLLALESQSWNGRMTSCPCSVTTIVRISCMNINYIYISFIQFGCENTKH